MCGIFGYFDQNSMALSRRTLEQMASKIYHRGPDGLGLFELPEKGVALGNQRLAILDLEHGDQPFISDDDQIVVVQNGEIFNHLELAEELAKSGYLCKTHCDTEVILRLYERDGINGLNKLNGMFSIAIFDKSLDKIFLIRDRVGEKPLYFCNLEGCILFASEIKSLLVIAKPTVNLKALKQYLGFNYVPIPQTMFSDIYHVRPGHYLEICRGKVEEKEWWNLSAIEVNEEITEQEWIDTLNYTLSDAVKLRLRSDVPFGAFLSGGVDSSSVVGYMAKHMDIPVKTYCIGFDDPKYDESPYASEAAERFGTQHKTEIVQPNLLSLWSLATYHCDQPHGDVSFLPTYRVAKLASSEVKMVLTGDGADELFAGYDKYKTFFSDTHNFTSDDKSFVRDYAQNIQLFSADNIMNLLSEEVKSKAGNVDECAEVVAQILEEVPHMDRINKALYLDTKLLLSGNNLVKPDRMGMAVSIENRAPFLDFRMIELAFSIPGNLKLFEGETKYIYKKAVSSLIGANLAYREKQMFTVPVGEWFKTSLKALCEELLLSDSVINRGFFNYDFVERLLAEHCENKKNNTREIRALMAFEYWCREFLDQ